MAESAGSEPALRAAEWRSVELAGLPEVIGHHDVMDSWACAMAAV